MKINDPEIEFVINPGNIKKFILRNFKIIAIYMILGALFSVAILLANPNKYRASTTIASNYIYQNESSYIENFEIIKRGYMEGLINKDFSPNGACNDSSWTNIFTDNQKRLNINIKKIGKDDVVEIIVDGVGEKELRACTAGIIDSLMKIHQARQAFRSESLKKELESSLKNIGNIEFNINSINLNEIVKIFTYFIDKNLQHQIKLNMAFNAKYNFYTVSEFKVINKMTYLHTLFVVMMGAFMGLFIGIITKLNKDKN